MSAPTTVAHWSQLALDAPGRSLVEASAGTGKTWTIAVLYLRLLLEPARAFTVDQVVVTTFTEAAAQELRERLRKRLREALAAVDSTEAVAMSEALPDDVAWLQARWRDPAVKLEDRRRLRLALADFDRAPVGTLHGLCQRILLEHPFESGSRFEPGVPTSGQALADELARDAWRVLHQGAAAFPDGVEAEELKLATFSKQLKQMMAPGIHIDADAPDLDRVRAGLPAGVVSALREVVADVGWFERKNSALLTALTKLADLLDGAGTWPSESQSQLIRELSLDKQVRVDRREAFLALPVISGLREWFPRVEAARHVPLLRFWQQQVAQAEGWRDERLAARGQVTFDEMIRRAHAAMTANPDLADVLFAAWPVALVDEFQDTDALQYGILDRLYRDRAEALRGRLVMIGDPKQAIYGFRGGDIHAYRRARCDAQEKLVLDTNHRSSSAYVAALNQWFAAGGEILGQAGAGDDVRYLPVLASDQSGKPQYTVDGIAPAAPLHVHFNPEDPASQPARRRQALADCANRIAAMLASNTHAIGGKPITPHDIAVLLPTNRDISSLRALLQARGVPCVGGARDSVFAGDMAFELHLVLGAVMAQDDESALRAALLTRLWGLDLAALAALDDDAPAWAPISDALNRLRRRWREQGVLAVTQQLAAEAAPRLLASPAGERELTDLRHLGELLQQRAERGGGARDLLAWLAEQRRDDGDADSADERQPRLESDAPRVRLMTLHRSKGLEFPIVFLPLMWAHDGGATHRPYLVPLPTGGRRAAFDEAAKAVAKWEGQDERYRTLYVALTRAVHACHLHALPSDRLPKSNSAQPRTDPERAPLDAMVERLLRPGIPPMPNVDWRTQAWSQDTVRLPSAIQSAPVRAARDEPAATPLRQRLSFSTLVSGHRQAATEESPADDEPLVTESLLDLPPEAPAHPSLLALSAVRGTAFGNALHSVFEDRAHDRPLASQTDLLLDHLDGFGVRPRDTRLETLVPALAARLDGALAAELLPGLRLVDVPASAQRAEMAFHFSLDHARLSRLRAACAEHGDATLVPQLAIESLRGLMTGKIDLVFEHAGRFHVLDYKGNWLGEHLADYRGAALREAMDHSHYRLQALVYTLAVHRFLDQRLPDYAYARHLGEFIYLFVRGAGLEPGCGVYVERFPETLVRAADAALSERSVPA